jgi:hypothetical protein
MSAIYIDLCFIEHSMPSYGCSFLSRDRTRGCLTPVMSSEEPAQALMRARRKSSRLPSWTTKPAISRRSVVRCCWSDSLHTARMHKGRAGAALRTCGSSIRLGLRDDGGLRAGVEVRRYLDMLEIRDHIVQEAATEEVQS